ncbi:MAG: PspC domain-containing protein [Candidatus Adiutrix sp.]|jgi:phage shock protein C|nr:PspC domain-containing protein [Candidatus Adiutrix sp.]
MTSPDARGFTAQLRTYGPFRAKDGLIFGVARGLADHFQWPVGLVRLAFILSAVCLFLWPTVLAYLAAAWLLSPSPEGRLDTQEERDIWLQAQLDPEAALEQLARRSAAVEKRLRRLEDFVTSRDFAWEQALRR